MNYQIKDVELVEGKLTYTTGDGTVVEEELNLTNLINIIIAFINALLKYEF